MLKRKINENILMILLIISMLTIFVGSKLKNNSIDILSILLFGIYFLASLYHDIRNRKYTTSIFIIAAGIIQVLAFIALCYFNFQNIDKTDYDLLWNRKTNFRNSGFIMLLMTSIITMLKSERFEKNNS